MALRFWRALRASVLYGTEARKAQKIIVDTVLGRARVCAGVCGCAWVSLTVSPIIFSALLASVPYSTEARKALQKHKATVRWSEQV